MRKCASNKGQQAPELRGDIEAPAPAPDPIEGWEMAVAGLPEPPELPDLPDFPADLLLQAEEASRILNAQAEEANRAMIAELSGEELTP